MRLRVQFDEDPDIDGTSQSNRRVKTKKKAIRNRPREPRHDLIREIEKNSKSSPITRLNGKRIPPGLAMRALAR